MEYRVLGPLEIHDEGRRIPLGGRKQRTLLMVLLLNANRVVSSDRLITALWGEAPPAGATAQLHTYVSRLRRLLGGGPGQGRKVLVGEPPGYRLCVRAGELDLDEFDRLEKSARESRTAGRPADAAADLRAALALWRGPVMQDVDADLARLEGVRLDERRLAALEERIDVDLAQGHHAQAVVELTALIQEHPLRERLRGQLMLALHRCNRSADALVHLRDYRSLLRDETGLDPGYELTELERSILNDDPGLRLPAADGADVTATVPAQLPRDIPDFTGRTHEIARAVALIRPRDDGRGVPPVLMVNGPGGVGKTAFAVHVAHRLRDSFPDGQLFVDLRGATAAPAEPSAILGRFLCALGVPGSAIPASTDERAALYRSLLAGRRVLVTLDNAAAEAQVRPLLPGSGTSAVLVTGRRSLSGLEGAAPLELGLPGADEAIALLNGIVGTARADADAEAAHHIAVRLCARLPLAIRIAGSRLVTRPSWSLAKLAALLGDEERRLDELTVGDQAVRASIELSYRTLDNGSARAFRLLGLLNTPDFPAWAAAALTGAAPRQGELFIERLLDARLLETTGTCRDDRVRYRFHDLVRTYARERAHAEEPIPQRDRALRRCLTRWLALAEDADDRLPVRLAVRAADEELPRPDGPPPGDPVTWFGAECAALIAGCEQAAAAGFDDLAWRLAAALLNYFDLRSLHDYWRHTHDVALDACRTAGNRLGEAVIRRGLAMLLWETEQLGDGLHAHIDRSLGLFQELGRRSAEADLLLLRADAAQRLGRYDESLALAGRAETVARAENYRLGEMRAQATCGAVHTEQGLLGDAARRYERVRRLAVENGAVLDQIRAHRALGVIYREQDRFAPSAESFHAALALCRVTGHRAEEAYAIAGLGELYVRQSHPAAHAMLRRSLHQFRELGGESGTALALRALGDFEVAHGRPGAAIALLEDSVRRWRAIGAPYGQALALESLGQAHVDTGDAGAGLAAWAKALRLLAGCDCDRVIDLGKRMAAIQGATRSAAAAQRADDGHARREHG